MPRGRPAEKRDIKPDYLHGSRFVAYFISCVMTRGKRSTAESLVYGAMDRIQQRTGANPLETFEKALKNVFPALEVRGRRVGGHTYAIPIEVRPDRRLSLGTRWIVSSARARPGKTMVDKLADEIMDAANNTGSAVKKKEDTHRMAEANRAFAHYRW